jgi:hypothetical protein
MSATADVMAYTHPLSFPKCDAWNKSLLIGPTRSFLSKQVWAIRARLELAGNIHDLALFKLAIDSKLRGCDFIKLRLADLLVGARFRERVTIIPQTTPKLSDVRTSPAN